MFRSLAVKLNVRRRGARALHSTATRLAKNDPGGLKEFSVVYNDRALNHMSASFCAVMNDLSGTLKHAYSAHSAVVIPGSGSYAMEAVARQFATRLPAMVVRNGFFSYRWTDILTTGSIPETETVLTARPTGGALPTQYAPPAVDEVVTAIHRDKPAVLFAPHVETSVGMILPDSYIRTIATAMHDVGGLMVLDCIASGAAWVDMDDVGVDVVVSAPQKGWTGPACAGLAMLSERARKRVDETQATSFSCNLAKWLGVMEAYEAGGFSYYTTMATDGLYEFRDVCREIEEFGFAKMEAAQWDLGDRVRELFHVNGFTSVAAPGFQAPGVLVFHTEDAGIVGKFKEAGVQVAAGVPFMIGEPNTTQTFRIGLFGLDKLKNIDKTVADMDAALKSVLAG